MQSQKHTNDLIHESSPYLLQHAHNPVNWVPWSQNALQQAEKEGKLVLVSVGYSACHWCHVMEHESFENEEVAELMNRHFVCIKVDREERPDVDQVYMTAVQLMTQQGGWPLNCFALPNGKPIYGGTYFPKDQWMHILRSLEHTYRTKRDEVLKYAENLSDGVQQSDWVQKVENTDGLNESKLHDLVRKWEASFDEIDGGNKRAPKFPLPSNLNFLLNYAKQNNKETVLNHVELTLDKMAMGGIYDQIAGGFARYSVDMLWKVPHFEKMLYDNGQLLSSYAKAYQVLPKPLYKRVCYQTIEWLETEMRSEFGAFYSALDADSEGVEGKFYIWQLAELKEVLGADFDWVKDFYSINGKGYWEEENYILLQSEKEAVFAEKRGWTAQEFETKLTAVNQNLKNARKSRIRPGLDDKCLTSWNAICMTGLLDCYAAFGEKRFLELATDIAAWIQKYQVQNDGSLLRNFKNGKATISAFLEDYAHTIEAFIRLYELTFEAKYIEFAKQVTDYTRIHFQDEATACFYFTANDTELIARKMEINDNVIPASNSVMAHNLIRLGHFYENKNYLNDARQMIANVYDGMDAYGSGYSNWAEALMTFVYPYRELVITGPDWKENLFQISKNYLPNTLLAGGEEEHHFPLLTHRISQVKNQLFLCEGTHCLAPFDSVEKLINKLFF